MQPFVNFVRCGTEIISYLGSKNWGMVPDTCKNIDSLYNFKKVIKNGSLRTAHTEFVRFLSEKIGSCEVGWIIMFLSPEAFYLFIFFFYIS